MTRSERLDVLHVVPTLDVGGAERMLLDLLPALVERGYRTGVCVLGTGGAFATRMEQSGITVHRCGMRRLVDGGAGTLRLMGHLRRLRPRVIHSHLVWADVAVSMARLVAGRAPFLVTLHGDPQLVSRPGRALWRMALARADEVLVFTQFAREAAKRAGAVADRIRVIPVGICDPGVPSVAECVAARSRLGFAASDVVVGTVCRLEPVKGLDILLDAWRRVMQEAPSAHLLVIGGGREAATLQASVSREGAPPRVRFLGQQDDLGPLYAALDVFVLASRSETLSLSLLEAMARARPVVVTRVGGLPEVVAGGAAGVLVPMGDADALAEALLALIRNAAQREALARAARQHFENAYSLARELRCLERIYRDLGVRPSAGRAAVAVSEAVRATVGEPG